MTDARGDTALHQAIAQQRARVFRHVAIHVVLLLIFFIPGGLVWNRLDPTILGLPFSVFFTAVLMPLIIILNVALYVKGFWQEDKTVSSEVRRGVSIHRADQASVDPRANPGHDRNS